MKKRYQFLFLLLATLTLAACASSRAGNVYSRDEARQPLAVSYGTVLEVKPVTIEGTKSPVGAIMGGAAGAALGNTIGGGTGRTAATVLGGIVGVLAGSALEEGVTQKEGLEIVVELDDGQIVAVVQEADDVYRVGDRVRLLKSANGTTRVRQ